MPAIKKDNSKKGRVTSMTAAVKKSKTYKGALASSRVINAFKSGPDTLRQKAKPEKAAKVRARLGKQYI